MLVKIFEGSTEQCTEQANAWLKRATKIKVVSVSLVPPRTLYGYGEEAGSVHIPWSSLILVYEEDAIDVHKDI